MEKEKTNKYIEVSLVDAYPMTREEYNNFRGWQIPKDENPMDDGYLVQHPNNYVTWSPKDVFEKHNLKLLDSDRISKSKVNSFIKEIDSVKFGNKTTVVNITLINGFEVIESSSCVDPENYDHEMGVQICTDRAKERIQELLGFLLQCASNGFDI